MTYRIVPPAPKDIELGRGSLVTIGECSMPPATAGWLHEIKVDGWRLALLTDGEGGMRLQTKSGIDRTWDFQEPVRALANCGHRMIIDGEVGVPNLLGITRLRDLQVAMKDATPERLAYFPFDLLHLDGEDFRPLPIEQRKTTLELVLKSISARTPLPRVMMVESIIVPGPEVLAGAQSLGADGIVSKRLGSPYVGGNTPSVTWVKSICSPSKGGNHS